MKHHHPLPWTHLEFSISPIVHAIGGFFTDVGHLIGGGGQAAAPTPTAPAAPTATAPPVQSPVGTASTYKTGTGPSFLAAAAAPQQSQLGQKTLLGQ